MTEFDDLRRDSFKLRTALADASDAIGQANKELSDQLQRTSEELRRTIGYLDKQLDVHEQLIEERLRTARLTQELNSWKRFALAYAQTLERTLAHPCLTDAYRDAAATLLHDFRRIVGPLGIDLIIPLQGDPFDERVHQSIGVEQVTGIPPFSVARCESWGFRDGSVVLERARVVVTPENGRSFHCCSPDQKGRAE